MLQDPVQRAPVPCHCSFIQARPAPGGPLRLLARVEQSPGVRSVRLVQRDGRLWWQGAGRSLPGFGSQGPGGAAWCCHRPRSRCESATRRRPGHDRRRVTSVGLCFDKDRGPGAEGLAACLAFTHRSPFFAAEPADAVDARRFAFLARAARTAAALRLFQAIRWPSGECTHSPSGACRPQTIAPQRRCAAMQAAALLLHRCIGHRHP